MSDGGSVFIDRSVYKILLQAFLIQDYAEKHQFVNFFFTISLYCAKITYVIKSLYGGY